MGPVRTLADRFVQEYARLHPVAAAFLGLPGDDTALTDYSPEGNDERAALEQRTLAELDALVASGEPLDDVERGCERLLRERLSANLAIHDAREHLRDLNHLGSPTQDIRAVFDNMPVSTADEWTVVLERLRKVPDALTTVRASLEAGRHRGLFAAPRQVEAVVEQVDTWTGRSGATPWFAGFVAPAPDPVRRSLEQAAAAAADALAAHRAYLSGTYLPEAVGQPDAVGEERYRRFVRLFNGADLDLHEAYEWGWEEHLRIDAEMRREAERVLPGATPLEAMRHLDEHGEAVHGVDAVRDWLQAIMDEAIDRLDGTHFDLDPRVKVVEAMIAPPGTSAAAYYTPPPLDFSRPGRTWLPTLGRDRFPVWELVSTWYHEGVPGHHLQLAYWNVLAPQLSVFQTTMGWVSANVEGWALYAERLMDELGFFEDPGRRLGFLTGQQLRAVRVVVDIGMHLELAIPAGSFHPGERWTPDLGLEFMLANAGSDEEMLRSEVVRYLGVPGQAIGYKLGERAWLAGRERARAAKGAAFDLKSWHMAALSTGSLGLDDLTEVLASL